jgi:hypothetical protein
MSGRLRPRVHLSDPVPLAQDPAHEQRGKPLHEADEVTK